MSAIGPAPIPSPVRARRTLLSSCAVASAMVVLGHTVPAAADGYNGTITGSVNYSGPTTANQATINLTGSSSVLTWTPTNAAVAGTINFQDTGAVTTFVGPGGARDSNFSVLNRVVPGTALPSGASPSVTFNGTTNGLGSILFYSPGGIIISPTARFDVGRLLLSTNDITLSENGYGRQSFDFTGTAGSLATIEVQPGADSSRGLFASGSGANYVALVAPRIIQNGNVSAVQTAYVAAEAGNLTTDINVNSGLFSFAITTGTTAADALTHGGVTTLTNNESTAGRAFMVAVPKNSAITMLVGGSVTYADQASVEDGAVILSTGGVQVSDSGLIRPTALNANPDVGAANITIAGTGGSFTSIYAAARSQVTTTGSFSITGDANLFGGTGASFGAAGGATVSVNKINGETGGNLSLTSFATGTDGAQTGGLASLFSTGGSTVTIAGDATIDASGRATGGSVAANGTGGSATLTVSNATLDILGAAELAADGAGATGGAGAGGIANVTVTSGAVTIGESGYGGLSVHADGVGGDSAQLGGAGTGGQASIVANGLLFANAGPTIRISRSTTVSANGTGGTASDDSGTGATGGIGRGGTASVSVGAARLASDVNQGSVVSDSGALTVSAIGSGGGDNSDGSNSNGVVRGGDAFGGGASLTLTGGSLSVSGVDVEAQAVGGSGSSGYGRDGGAGGNGTAGTASMTVEDLRTGTGTVTDPFFYTASNLVTGDLQVNANATGGRGGDTQSFGQTIGAGAGGAAIGSRAVLEIATATTLSLGSITVSAAARGGDGGSVNGSPATGDGVSLGGAGGSGSAGVESMNAGTTQAPLAAGAYIFIPGTSATPASGTVSITKVAVQADGTGGTGGISAGGYGAGGAGIGGTASLVDVGSGESSLSASSSGNIVSARGIGGASGGDGSDPTGVGGDGFGGGYGTTAGGARVYLGGGSINLPDLAVDGSAQGGAGNLAGGNAVGGAASLELVNGAPINSNIALTLNANATGGNAFDSYTFTDHDVGVGGSATGGAVSLQIYNGSAPTFDNAVSLTADGLGASQINGAGYFKGGAGTGGSASVSVSANGNATFTNGVSASASGTGGNSFYTAGGTGTGGTASFTVDSATATTPTLTLTAAGTGGDGGPPTFSSERVIGERQDGGAGVGGTARLLVQGSGTQTTNLIVTSATNLDVHGGGGASTGYGDGSQFVTGAVGGSGTGGGFGTQPGGALVTVGSGGGASLADLTLIAEGSGGGSVQGGAGGSGFGGTAAINVGIGDGTSSRLSTNSISVRAGGFGAFNESGYGPTGGDGGAATGGRALLTINGGAFTNATTASFDASATGADGSDAGETVEQAPGAGGAAMGGTAGITSTGGGTIDTGAVTLAADATGGRGGAGNFLGSGAGGAATGGNASINATAGITPGAITLSGNLRVSADATGGDGGTGGDGESGAAGGVARGGSASVVSDGVPITVADETEGTITAFLSATAAGGYGGGLFDYSGNTPGPIGGAGADAFGGSVTMTALNGGRIALGNLAFDASASGGYGAPSVAGGNAVGGTATLSITNDGTIVATDAAANDSLAPVTFDVHAQGGQGGGSGTGGAVSLTSDSGSYSGDMAVDLSAVGTDGVDGHYGTSGAAGGSARAGSFTLALAGSTVDNLAITALATAGNGGNAIEAGYGGSGGAGGDVSGATISLTAGDGSSINVRSDLLQLGTLVGGTGGNGATGTNGTTGADGIAATATGATGGAGQKGGAGTAGGAGGRGGNATGAAINLTASLGTLTLSGGEGSASFDLTATGGIGGAGAAGGDGGAGGTGGAGGPAGRTIPAGPQGANGIQGDAGISGDGGAGGNGTGGSLTLATSDATGAVSFGDLSVDNSATGGNSGAGGGPSFGGADRPFSFGNSPLGGTAVGSMVALNTGSTDNGPLPTGTITGGGLSVVSVSTPGLDAAGNHGAAGLNGRFQLYAASTSNADDTSPAGSIKLDSLSVTVGGGQDQAFQGRDGAPVGITALGSNIVIANDATINTNGRVNIRADAGGQINVGDLLNIDAGQVQAVTNGSGDAAGRITANAVRYSAGAGIYSNLPTVATRSGDTAGTIIFASAAELYAENLTATDSISLTAGTNLFDPTLPTLTVGNIRTTAAVDPTATSLDTAGGGTISIVAGANFNTSLVPNTGLDNGSIEVDGPISASNTVQLTAGGSIHVRGDVGAQISSDNLLRIDAGDDVVIDSGAFVRAGLNPLADPAEGTGPQDLNTPAALYITAGVQQQNAPDPANVSVVSIGGTVTSGIVTDGVLSANSADRRAIQLTGQAVQTEGGTLGARSLNVDIVGGPAPNTNTDTDLNLANGCLRGDVCLGAFDLTDRLIVGGLGDDVAALPTTVRIADGADIATTIVRAQGDITLGTDEGASLFGGNDLLRVQSFGGTVNLLGGTTLRSTSGEGTFQVAGEQGIVGGGATLQSDGQIGLYTGSGGLALDTLRAGSLTGLNADLSSTGSSTLAVSGPVTINSLLAVSNGDIDISAGENLFVQSAAVNEGFSIRLASTGGNAVLNGTPGDTLGQAFDITVSSDTGDATLNNASAERDITVTAAGNASVDQITAGDDITINGATATIGSANTAGTSVESGYGADGSNLSVTATGNIDVTGTADAFDTLRLTSTGGGRITANTLTAGDDVFVSGGGLNIASVTSRGTSLENGYGATPDGSNITLTANGPDGPDLPAILVTNANAAQDLTISATNEGGTIDTTSLTAGRDIDLTSLASLGVTGGSAGRDFTATSTQGSITGGTLSAGQDLSLSGNLDANLDNGTAGRSLTLTAGGLASAGTLSAGDDVTINGGTISLLSATSTGTFVDTGDGADGSNVTLTANGDIAVSGSADAFDTLTINSSGGRVTANVLTAGDDAIVSGSTLQIDSVVSRGTSLRNGDGTTPNDSNIVLTATGADLPEQPALIVVNANAFQDLTVQEANEGGAISGGTLSAGRDIAISSLSDAAITSGMAGRDILLASSNASVGADTLSAGRDITENAATSAYIGTGSAGRDLTMTAGTIAASDTSLTAGDDISVTGNAISIGSVTSTGTFAESGYGADGSNVTLAAAGDIDVRGTANAFDTLRITSEGGQVSADQLTAGDDAIVSGNTLSINSVVSRGTSLENGYGATPDGSNISLTATGGAPGILAVNVTSANAFQDLTVAANGDGGTISGGTLTAGRDAVITASGAANVTGGTAGNDYTLTSTNDAVAGGTLSAGNDLTVSGGTTAMLASGTAGRDLTLAAGTDATLTAGTAGDDIFVNGATVTIGSANTTGAFAESGYGADGSNITVGASGTIAITGTVDAFGDLTVASSGGRVTGNVLTAGDDANISGAGLSLTSVTSRGTAPEAGYGATPDGSNIVLTATGAGVPTLPAILVTTANAAQDLTLQATSASGSIAATSLIAGRDIAGTAGGAIGVTSADAGRDLSLTSTNGTLGGTSLTAGRNIAVAALGNVTIGDAIANGPVILSSDPTNPVPTSGIVSIAAGRTGGAGGYAASDITLTGTVRAAGNVLAMAGGDIIVAPTARVQSDNRITLNAGDDVLIRGGAVVSAALAPLPATIVTSSSGISSVVSPAALVLGAGTVALGYTPAAGNVASLIVDGTLNSASRPVLLTAGAIQADTSALTAGSLTVNVANAPAAGAAQSNDGGQLRLGCLQGDVCLGAVTLTGFTAGTTAIPGALTIGQTNRPTNVRVAGAVDVASIDISASDGIYLGSATAPSPIAQTAAGRVALTAGGAVNLLGSLTLTGGATTGASFGGRTVSLDAGTDVTGTGASIVSRGPLAVDAGGSVTLASTSSGEATRITATGGDIQIDRLTTLLIENSGDGPGSGVFLTAGGSVSGQGDNAADIDAVGDVNVRAGGDVRLGTAIARDGTGSSDIDGSDIDIVAGGAVSLASGTASDDAFVTAGTDLTIGTLTANGETDNDPADTAGGNIRLAGNTIGAGTLTATTAIDARALTFLRVDDASSPGTITFAAAGTDAPPTNDAPDGTLAVELGTVDAGTQLTIGAQNGGIRFASLAAPDITLDAATRIAGGDATARNGGVSATASGDIVLGTVTATGDITADAGGAFSAASLASAVGSTAVDFHQIRVTAGTTIDIGAARADRGNVDLSAAGALNLGAGSAGDTVRLASSGDSIVTGALVAGTSPNTDEGYQGAITADAGTFAQIASATALGNIAVTARGGDIALDSATAGRAITLDAAAGGIGAQALAAGDTITANARDDIAIGTATAGTAIDLTAMLGAIRATSLASGTAAPAGTTLTAGTDVTFGTIASSADVTVDAGGAITGDTVSATGAIDLAAGGAVRVTTDIVGDTITASGTDIALNALGNLNLATVDATAGNVALTSSGGAVTVDRATATGAVLLASGEGVSGTPDAARFVTANTVQAGTDVIVNALGAIGVGTATAGGSITLSGAGAVTLGGGNAGLDTNVNARDAATIGPVTTGRDFALDAGGNATLANVTAGGTLSANATGTLAATTLRGADDIALSSGGNLSFTSATSTGGDISANSGGDLSFGSVDAAGSVLLAATGGLGPIDNGSITAGDSISATTGLDLTLTSLSAVNNLTLNAGGALAIVDATARAGILTLTAGNTLTVSGTGQAGTSAAIGAGGAVDLASIVAGTTITARSSAGTLNADTLRAGGDIALTSAGDLTLGDGASTLGGIVLNGGAVRVGTASAAGTFSATASDTIDIAAPLLTAGRGIMLNAGGVLTANGLRATNSIVANGGGAVRVGDVESVGGTVRSISGGSLTVGNVRAAGSIFLTAAAAVTAGDLTAGTGPILPGEGATTGTGIGGTGAGGTDLATAGIAAGFDQSTIVRCDDCFTDPVTLPFLVNYFGNTYTTTYVSNNGYLTFNQGQGEYTPTGLGAAYRGQPIIAAFFADVDTRDSRSSQVTYGTGTFAGRQAFGATYDNVGYFDTQGDKLNSFQIVLTNRADTGTGNFDIYYNYTKINWETGSASGGTNGFGGVSAAVGYNAGTGGQAGTYFELAGSTVPGSFLNGGTAPLITGTNNGTPGQLVFMVRNGAIATGGVAERPTVHVSNAAGTTPADIRLGNISAEAAEVHGSGAVTVGDVNVGDRGSGIATTGQAYATVLDAATNLTTGNIMSTGLVTLGARTGDLLGGTITTASSAVALVGGAVQLGAVTTGTGTGDSLFISDPAILAGGTALPGFDFDTLLTGTTFDPATLASATPQRTGGALALGPVTTGNFIAAAGGASSLGAIDATGAIRIDSGGNLTTTSLNAGGDITATTDQNLVFASADADGSVTLGAGGTLSPVSNGTIDAGGSITATSGQALTVGDLSAVDDLTLNAGGRLTTGALNAGGDIVAGAGDDLTFRSADAGGGVTLISAGGLSPIDTGTITAGTSISATTGRDLTVGSLIANTDLTLRSGGALTLGSGVARGGSLTLAAAGPLTVSGTATAGDDAVFTAGGAINTGAVTGGDTIAINSTGGDVTATDLLATNGITVRALGNLFVRDAVANATNGNVSLTSGFPFGSAGATPPFLLTGNTSVSGTVSAGTVTIQGGGDVLLASAARIRSDGTILIASGDDIVADAGSVIGLGQITRTLPGTQVPDRIGGPADTVTLSAGSLRRGSANLAANGTSAILMNGTVDGLAIAFNSEAVDIGSTGQVGSAATTAAVFTNNGTGGTIVGGTASDTTAYTLSNAALGRTRAQAIRVVAPADVVVRQLGLSGSAATAGNLLGGNASFEIATPGSVSVEGAAAITSAAQTDLFAITAGNRITVLTPGGSIALNGTGGALAGRIRLAAPRITVATQTAVTALDGLTTLDARDERLASNDGTLSDAGFLQAGGLEFRVSNGLYIQNSGATRVSDTRRGFTAGTGGVTIVTTGTSPAEIAINGRQALADGTFVTGRTLIDRLTLSGTGQATMASFDPRSTVNGCLIVGMTCRFDGTAPTQPIQDVINQIINGQDDITGAISSVVQQLNSPLIDLIDFTPFRLSGIIDEPVTGAGNDDFYTAFTGDDDAMSTSVTVDEQVTGTGRDQTTDEAVTGTGRDQPGTSEQVTGTGRDQIEKSDGKCDPTKKKTDPDCK